MYALAYPSAYVCLSYPSLTKHTYVGRPTHPPPRMHIFLFILLLICPPLFCDSTLPFVPGWEKLASSLASPIEQDDLQAARRVGAVTENQVDPPLIVFHG